MINYTEFDLKCAETRLQESRDKIKNINDLINQYNADIDLLSKINIKTMKKHIKEESDEKIIEKWSNKTKAINQRNKRIRKLNRVIKGYKKEIDKENKNIVYLKEEIYKLIKNNQ